LLQSTEIVGARAANRITRLTLLAFTPTRPAASGSTQSIAPMLVARIATKQQTFRLSVGRFRYSALVTKHSALQHLSQRRCFVTFGD
jgi:hypothetical protein